MMSGGELEKMLNEHADKGWQLNAITAVDRAGGLGLAVARS
ncbi:MAG: DUF4177 domain-containing protein [Actinomycetota bacterium]|nr:DUF4177 domain-containing protein [Actinomycetota bacterium]